MATVGIVEFRRDSSIFLEHHEEILGLATQYVHPGIEIIRVLRLKWWGVPACLSGSRSPGLTSGMSESRALSAMNASTCPLDHRIDRPRPSRQSVERSEINRIAGVSTG